MTDGLRALFEFFFKYRPTVFAQGDLAFGARWPVLVIVAIGAVLLVPALRSYGAARGKSDARDRRILIGLRAAILVALVVCLLRPMLILNAAVPQRNYVGVLIDDSRSMQIADRDGRSRADYVRDSVSVANSPVLRSLRDRFQVRLFRFGRSADRVDDARTLGFTEPATHLGDAIEGARASLESVPLSGLVVVTDGADNAHRPLGDLLRDLRARGVPIFTVGVGTERFAKDIEVRRVETPRTVLKGSTVVADLLIRQRGYDGAKVPLIVEDDGRIVGRSEITLPAGDEATPIKVQVRLSVPGARTLTFRIPDQPGEQVEQNNAQRALVRVRDGREKILYVEGEPRYEAKFLRNAVESDSTLQLVVLQRTAEGKFLRLGVDGPEDLLAGFPRTRAELYRYRAVVLGSIEASYFTKDQLAMLADFVNVRGGGLLFLGGRRAFAEGGYAGTAVADVMPVVIDGVANTDDNGFIADLTPSLTPSGFSSAVTQVVNAADSVGRKGGSLPTTAEKWETMPGVTSVNRIRRVKPGAVTLIAGRQSKGGRAGTQGVESLTGYEQPILVSQRYGRGLAVALPVQDSWTWQMGATVDPDDESFEIFWRQLLRWLTSDVPGRITARLATDQVGPRVPVELRAEVVDSTFVKVNDAQVMAHITDTTGAVKDVPLEWTVDRDGEYKATFTPEGFGVHLVTVDATSPTGGAARDTAYLRVADLDDEFVDAEQHADLLKRIAEETGGRYYTPATTGTLAEDVALSKRGVTVVNEMDLWDMPVNFILLIGLVSAEWGYRKSRGLA